MFTSYRNATVNECSHGSDLTPNLA